MLIKLGTSHQTDLCKRSRSQQRSRMFKSMFAIFTKMYSSANTSSFYAYTCGIIFDYFSMTNFDNNKM